MRTKGQLSGSFNVHSLLAFYWRWKKYCNHREFSLLAHPVDCHLREAGATDRQLRTSSRKTGEPPRSTLVFQGGGLVAAAPHCGCVSKEPNAALGAEVRFRETKVGPSKTAAVLLCYPETPPIKTSRVSTPHRLSASIRNSVAPPKRGRCRAF